MATTPQQGKASALASGVGRAETAGVQGAWWKWGVGLLMTYVLYGAFFVAKGGKGFSGGDGDTARIVFIHVPPAIFSSLFFFIAAWQSFQFLKRDSDLEADRKAATAMEIGFLCCTLATVTGSIFSGAQWESYWNWDPRQTSIVFMLLLYAAYLVLRGAVANNPGQRAKLSASYVLVGLVPSIFLIWVIPRIVASLHPPDVIASKDGMSPDYKMVFYPSVLAFALLFTWMYQLRMRYQKLAMAREARRAR